MDERHFYNGVAIAVEGNYNALRKLSARYGSWERAYRTLREAPDAADAWEALRAEDVALIMRDDSGYPPLLREIPLAPFGIYCKGNATLFQKPSLAIVGTRKATAAGSELAASFAGRLSKHFAIVSGLALGIDAAAHKGCLAAGGNTIAVLATGLDRIYPATNARLAEEILARGGTLASEYPLGSPALPYRFLERNRIVSGLSRGIVVVEAPEESGALNTARFAAEHNRDVCVVPGPATHPNYRGAHALIREGATLVTSPEEVLEALGVTPEEISSAAAPCAADSPEEARIIAVLAAAGGPIDIDKIAELSTLNSQAAARTLGLLVIKGRAKETGEGFTAA